MRGWIATVAVVIVIVGVGVGLWATWDSTRVSDGSTLTAGPNLPIDTTTTSPLATTSTVRPDDPGVRARGTSRWRATPSPTGRRS